MIHGPHVDWFALSPELALLAASAVALLGAVLVPRSWRTPFAAVVAATGFVVSFAFDAVLFAQSPHGETIVAGAMRRDRFGALAGLIVAAAGLLAVGALLRRADPRAQRRVLRTPRGGRRRDDLPRLRRQPDDALPRSRVVLDRSLHPLRDRRRAGAVARGGAQVPRRRQLRLGDPALRLGARVRRDRQDRLRADRGGDRGAAPERRRAARRRARDAARRLRLQDLGGAVPHVDARRLRGRADAGDRRSCRRRRRPRRSR